MEDGNASLLDHELGDERNETIRLRTVTHENFKMIIHNCLIRVQPREVWLIVFV